MKEVIFILFTLQGEPGKPGLPGLAGPKVRQISDWPIQNSYNSTTTTAVMIINQNQGCCSRPCEDGGILKAALKGSYDVAKNNIILCSWCNAMCLRGSRLKKHIILHILYIIVAPLCSTFLKRADFYKACRSEKRGVLWLASYPVHCDWPNTSSVWRKRYSPYHVMMLWPARWV